MPSLNSAAVATPDGPRRLAPIPRVRRSRPRPCCRPARNAVPSDEVVDSRHALAWRGRAPGVAVAPWIQAGPSLSPVVADHASFRACQRSIDGPGEHLPEIGVQADAYAGLTRVPRRALGRRRPPCPGDGVLEGHHGRVVGAGDIDDRQPGFGACASWIGSTSVLRAPPRRGSARAPDFLDRVSLRNEQQCDIRIDREVSVVESASWV